MIINDLKKRASIKDKKTGEKIELPIYRGE